MAMLERLQTIARVSSIKKSFYNRFIYYDFLSIDKCSLLGSNISFAGPIVSHRLVDALHGLYEHLYFVHRYEPFSSPCQSQ